MSFLLIPFLFLTVCQGARSENTTEARLAKLSAEWKNCKSNADCPSNAGCFQGRICQCNLEYVEKNSDKGPMRCLPKALKLGDQCEDEMQCGATFGKLSKCLKNKESDPFGQCQCRENTQFRDGLCYPRSYIGDRCTVADQCYIESQENGTIAHCDTGRCVCPPDHHPSKNKRDCVKNAAYGALCKGDDDCVADQTECIYEQCRCKVKYVVNFDKTKCLPAAEVLSDTCIEDQQCTENLGNTMCDKKNNVCMCTPTSHQVNDKCLPDVVLLNKCDDKFECLIPSLNFSLVECHNGICQCTKGFKISPDNTDCLEDTSSGTSLTTSACLFTSMLLLLRWF